MRRTAAPLIDPFQRAITYLRVSVTDRCDFRCVYCMSEHMTFLPKADLLTPRRTRPAVQRLHRQGRAQAAADRRRAAGPARHHDLGVVAVAPLTSGALDELTLTTNGSQLTKYAGELKASGVKRINVSLDTLDPDKFRAITRWGDLDKVMAGIDAAQAAGLKVKINAVALKGVNEDEIAAMVEWAHGRGMDLTLIEVMPLGDIGDDRHRSVSAAVDGARAACRALHARRHRLSHRRPGPLRARQGNRRHGSASSRR